MAFELSDRGVKAGPAPAITPHEYPTHWIIVATVYLSHWVTEQRRPCLTASASVSILNIPKIVLPGEAGKPMCQPFIKSSYRLLSNSSLYYFNYSTFVDDGCGFATVLVRGAYLVGLLCGRGVLIDKVPSVPSSLSMENYKASIARG